MAHLKKTIQFFVLGMFFTQHVIVLPMHGHFSPAPIFSHVDSHSFSAAGSSTFKHIFSDISNNVSNNPHMYVVIVAGCIVAIVCTSVYKSGIFAKKFNFDSTVVTTPIQKEIQSSLDALPWALKGPIKVIVVPLKTLIHMLRAGVVNYVAYNKKHLGLSAASMIGGYVAGHPMIGGAVGGMVFLHGAFNNRFDITDGKIDAVDKKLDRQFATVSNEATENAKKIIEQVDTKAHELSEALTGVDLRLADVGAQVHKKIEGVAQQVVTVHDDVQKISGQINDLKAQLKVESSKGCERDQKADQALANLNVLSAQVNNFQITIEKVAFQAAEQQQVLAKNLEAQMNSLNEQLVQQGNVAQEVKDVQIAHGNTLTTIKQKVEEMLTLKSEYGSLVELFKDGQASNAATLKQLQEGQAKIEKAATEFSAFKVQLSRLEKSFAEHRANNAEVFALMTSEQSNVHRRLNGIEGDVSSLKVLLLQNQQQNTHMLAFLSRLENKQNQSTDKPSLEDSVEPKSVPFIPAKPFKQQLPRFNTFGLGTPMTSSSSSSIRQLQLEASKQ